MDALSGTLLVEILSAHDLQPCDFNGFSDPYCVLISGNTKTKTQTIKKTLNPEWNETVVLRVKKATEINVVVMDWDLIGANDVCGSAVLPLSRELLRGERVPVDLPLFPQGRVRMILEFHDDNCLFGLDLVSVCLRERRRVPQIVDMCIEAITLYGLDCGVWEYVCSS